MSLLTRAQAKWDAAKSFTVELWSRFRRWKLFVPALVTAPLVLIAGGFGGYSAWDSTRVDIPNVVGDSWPEGIATLKSLGLAVDEGEALDDALSPSCFVVSEQDIAAGTRVVADDTVVALEIEPDERLVPNVVGKTLLEAQDSLQAACFHEKVQPAWCVPEDFSGGEAALTLDELTEETGFSYDLATNLLLDGERTPDSAWIVCDQVQDPSTPQRSSSMVGLMLTVPLTTVPAASGMQLSQALTALKETDDSCALSPRIVPTFTPDPALIRGRSMPSAAETGVWMVGQLRPAVGHAALCGSTVSVDVEWPSTPMPQLIGLHHVPGTPTTATPATAALEAARLEATCSGRGTVTNQVPSAGAPLPVGNSVTCVAELVVPNIVGLDPTTANAVLAEAGLPGLGTGSGYVVSQSPAAGTIALPTQSVTHYAEQPRVLTFRGQPNVSAPSAYYENCTAVRAAGAAPLYRGQPGYAPKLDRDGDGVACE